MEWKALAAGLCVLLSVTAVCGSLRASPAPSTEEPSAGGIEVVPSEGAAGASPSPDGRPIYFEENVGQMPAEWSYGVRTSTGWFGLARGQIDASMIERGEAASPARIGADVHFVFEGASAVDPTAGQALAGSSNFALGSRLPSQVARHFGEVHYAGLWDGIDLVYSTGPAGLKYEYRLAPAVPASTIGIHVEGAEGLSIAPDGALRISTAAGTIVDTAPVARQGEAEVRCQFALRPPSDYGFECEGIDTGLPLVIDPIVYSTFAGGSNTEVSYALAVDGAGNTYLLGETWSADFTTTAGAIDRIFNGTNDVFVMKLNPAGTDVLWATYLGGNSTEGGNAIALDGAGAVYITGMTWSDDFPTTLGANQTTFGGGYWYYGDAFVAKINSTGAIVYSTYLGGYADDTGVSIAVNAVGEAFVVGTTVLDSFRTTANATNATPLGSWDAFVAKLSANGSKLLYGSYWGGAGNDFATDVALGPNDDVFVTGSTTSADFPVTASAYQRSIANATPAFVTRFNLRTSTVVYSTLVGGSTTSGASALLVDSAGNAIVAGTTDSTDFPTTEGAFDRSERGTDAYLLSLNAAGSALVFSTVLGGNDFDSATDVGVDANGDVYLTGHTTSVDFPTSASSPGPTHNGGSYDGFVARFNSNASRLLFGAYFGGWGDDYPRSIAVRSPYEVSVAGYTSSTNYPLTAGAPDQAFGGWWESFVTTIKTAFTTLFTTNPPGLVVQVEGANFTTPVVRPCVEGSSLKMFAPAVQVVNATRYLYTRWNHTAGASDQVTCTRDAEYAANYAVEYAMTIDSSTPGLIVRVDNRSYVTPYMFWCPAGSSVQLNATSPQIAGGIRSTFADWSDGGARTHNINCGGPASVRANFSLEYLLTIDTTPPGLDLVVNGTVSALPVSLWCVPSQTFTFSPVGTQERGGTRYVFSAWNDVAWPDRTHTCNAPGNYRATFIVTHQLINLFTDPPGLNLTLVNVPVSAPYPFWCANGSTLTLTAPTPQDLGRTRYAFAAWSVTPLPAPQVSVPCTAPQQVTATFRAQGYWVRVDTLPGALDIQVGAQTQVAPSAFWCDAGTSFVVNAPSPQPTGNARYVFANWSDGRGASHSSGCSGPLDLVASFTQEYRLVFDAVPVGTPLLVDGVSVATPATVWCTPGAHYNLSAEPQTTAPWTRLVLEGWLDAVSGPRVVACTAPAGFTARFAAEHKAVVATLPPRLELRVDGSAATAPVEFWWAEGSVHLVEFPSPQNVGGRNFVFDKWSDGGERFHQVAVAGPLNVTASASDVGEGDFALALDGPSVNAFVGGTAESSVKVASVNFYAAPALTLSLADLPEGVTATCEPAVVSPGGSCRLRVELAPSVRPGTYSFAVLATNGTVTHSLTVTLYVYSASPISASPPGGGVLLLAAVIGAVLLGVVFFGWWRVSRERRHAPPPAEPWMPNKR